jgi:copper transport protein
MMIKFNAKLSFQIFLVIIVISFIILIPNIPNSYAHAGVVKSDPSPNQSITTQPTSVDVYFNDPVDIRYSQIQVLNSNGKEIQQKDLHYINNNQNALSVSLPTGLKNGIYTVTTKVLDQTDGHVTKNYYVFGIGQTVPKNFTTTSSNYEEVSLPEAIVRFPALIGQVVVVGASFATLWLWRPISRISWLSNALDETRKKTDHDMIKLTVIGSILVVASDFAMISVQAYSINAGILDAISTKFGSIWTIRMVASVVLLALSYTMYHMIKKSNSIAPRNHVLGLISIGLVVLATTSLISHGAATGKILPLVLDFIHNVVASLWIGGIFYIAFVFMPNLKRIVNEEISVPTLSIIIPRFSIITISILGAIVITGPFLLNFLEGNLALTLGSFYGKILIVKLSLAAIMISLGAFNSMIIHKRAFHATPLLIIKDKAMISEKTNHVKSIITIFSKNTKIESLIGIALIASVAVLVDSGLPSSEFQNQLQLIPQPNIFALATADLVSGHQFTETKFIENADRIVLTINPFATGNNNFKISFLDSNKNPIDMKSVQLRLTQSDMGIGPNTIDAKQISSGVFSVNTAFGFSGHWNLQAEGIQNKENSLNLVASFDLLVKPQLDNLEVNIKEFKMPENGSLPFYPVFDNSRNVVWVGDSLIKSGRIFEFDLNSTKFIEHKIDGINIVSAIALDSRNNIWYTDPITKSLGNYNPNDNSNNIYKVPTQGIISGIAIDNSNNIWLIDATSNEVLKFDPDVKNFTSIKLASNSQPLGITIDKSIGQIWVAEGVGKIASIDPNNYKINEYAPREQNVTLATPTGIISDPETGNIYISEHDGYAVSVFNPILKTFKKYTLDSHGLPLGMAFDNYHNLWVAQHTLDKIAVVNPMTGQSREFNVPSSDSFVQWITIDSQGNIIMAEQRANALGIITTTVNAVTQDISHENQTSNLPLGIPSLGFSYADVVAPSIAGLLIVVAFFYSKGVIDFKRSTRQVEKHKLTN